MGIIAVPLQWHLPNMNVIFKKSPETGKSNGTREVGLGTPSSGNGGREPRGINLLCQHFTRCRYQDKGTGYFVVMISSYRAVYNNYTEVTLWLCNISQFVFLVWTVGFLIRIPQRLACKISIVHEKCLISIPIDVYADNQNTENLRWS